MKKYYLIIIVFTLLVFSCDLFGSGNYGTRTFWSQNMQNDTFYQVKAELLVNGKHCNIWAETGSGISISEMTARSIAYEYDTYIYPKMMEVFGLTETTFEYGNYVIADNTIELADWFGDEDGKLCILLLDIKDDYIKNINDAYVAGYFWGGDLWPQYYSNAADMIYIDTYPGLLNISNVYRTLAHELQHLINTAISFYYTYLDESRQGLMDLWIDEGLSSAAEHIVYGKSESRLKDYNNDYSGLIEKGNNFFVWDNHDDEDTNAVLDDYATVYLFFQWLRIHSDKNIYSKIISSYFTDYKAVTEAAKTINSEYSDWGKLLGAWLAANHNSADGEDGYKGEYVIKKHFAPIEPKTIQLYPGEGVYSYTASNPNHVNSADIIYSYLDKSKALLTYNKNNNIKGGETSGSVTGARPPAADVIAFNGRSALASNVPAGPYPISINDMRRRRGLEENRPFIDFNHAADFFRQRGND